MSSDHLERWQIYCDTLILEGRYTILEGRDVMILVIESERSRTRKLWGNLGVDTPRNFECL